jgi:hypothetical protein
MTIIGVVVNDMPLLVNDTRFTTSFYKAFMNYCIENFPIRNNNSKILKSRFKAEQNHPEFKRARAYKRIVGHNGIYYSTYNDNKRKKVIMEEIATELGMNLRIVIGNNP